MPPAARTRPESRFAKIAKTHRARDHSLLSLAQSHGSRSLGTRAAQEQINRVAAGGCAVEGHGTGVRVADTEGK